MKVLLFGGRGESTNAVANALYEDFDVAVVLEEAVDRKKLLKRRIKKLGAGVVFGQVLFRVFVPPYLRRKSRNRINEIIEEFNLEVSEINPEIESYHVESINSKKTLEITARIEPDIIVVNGTRIITKEILDGLNVPIINMHMGITPKYRGVHGGYWAMANGDEENCGVTIHKVDEGIDTGSIISQRRIKTTKDDNYITYPYIQVGEGIILEKAILKEYDASGIINTYNVDLPSKLWTHPTLGQYIKGKK